MAYTTIDDPSAYFQTTLYSGNGSTQSITNGGNSDLQPDWVWIKERSASDDHKSYDSSRGTTKKISQNDTSTEENQEGLTAFNSDGFSLGSHAGSNQSSQTYVAWQWKANGGTRTTNTESGNNPAGGYQVNTTAGFSIVDFTGTGGAGTMAHGLGAVPKFYVVKGRTVGGSWRCYHADNGSDPETDSLKLDENIATADLAGWWNDTAPTSSVFSLGDDDQVNDDAGSFIGYFWTDIQGYSKFGSYTGNDNADGPFIYTGFKPAWVMMKKTDTTGSWIIKDNKIDSYNPATQVIYPDLPNAENDAQTLDLLSNGFKHRSAEGDGNDANTYTYMAFAEHPFVSSEGVPCTAR